jgi:hypothetical protein
MTTTAKLTLNQQRILGAVGGDWRSTAEVSRIAGVEARLVLTALYTRRLVDRRQIETGRLPLEWRLEPV